MTQRGHLEFEAPESLTFLDKSMDLSCISKSNSLRRTAKDKNGQLEEINDDKLNKLKA